MQGIMKDTHKTFQTNKQVFNTESTCAESLSQREIVDHN